MRVRAFVAAALIAGGTSLVGLPGTAAGQAVVTGGPPGHFTCEATSAAVRTPLLDLTSTQANAGGGACADDFAQALGARIPGSPMPPVVAASVLTAQTDADPAGVPGAKSVAEVAAATVYLGTTKLKADVLRAKARATCVDGEPALTGSSEVIGLKLGTQGGSFSQEVRITDPANPLLNIWLNEQTTRTNPDGSKVLTQRALHVFGLQANGFLVDIVLGEAVVDVHGNPCAPAPPLPQCSDGQDNDGDGTIDYGTAPGTDRGCNSPDDNDESDDPPPAQCSDGQDNDGDKLSDFPEDPGCNSPDDNDESDDKASSAAG